MVILWVVYKVELGLMYLDMTQMSLKQRYMFFIKYKWLECFPLISLYNMFRVLWAYYFFHIYLVIGVLWAP